MKFCSHQQQYPPLTEGKRLSELGLDSQEQKRIYSLHFQVTREIELSMFQYKIIHNILYAKKMDKKKNPYFPYCTSTKQTTMHLFCSCMIARWFWREFINWYNSLHSEKIPSFFEKEIVFGVLNNRPSSFLSESTFCTVICLRRI